MKKQRGPNGGARAGAGRPSKQTKYEAAATVVERAFDELEQNYLNMRDLADGKVEIVHEEWAAAGTIKRGLAKGSELVFEGREPDEMILVRRKVTRLAPNLAANEYLTDRVIGASTRKFHPPTAPRPKEPLNLDLLNPEEREIFLKLSHKLIYAGPPGRLRRASQNQIVSAENQ